MSYSIKAWTEKGSADNATARATRDAEEGKRHYVTALTGSYGNSKNGLLSILDGSTVVYEFFVYDTAHIEFPRPIAMTVGNAVHVELDASETGGTLGYVNVQGITL